MALSKDEQHTLDEMERTLSQDDPAFAKTLDFTRGQHHRIALGGAGFVLGGATLVAGEVVAQATVAVGVPLGVAGFVGMFTAIAWILRRPIGW